MNFRISFIKTLKLLHFRRLRSNLLHSIKVNGKKFFFENIVFSIKTKDII